MDPNIFQQQCGAQFRFYFAIFILVNILLFSFWDVAKYYCGFWGQNQMLLQVSVLIRQSSTSTLGTLSEPNKSYWKSNLSTEESSYEISHIRLPAFPCLFLFCSSLHFRKRIQVFCLLCVSVWPLRGPWCQLRWSAQCICGNKSQHVIIECKWIHHTDK